MLWTHSHTQRWHRGLVSIQLHVFQEYLSSKLPLFLPANSSSVCSLFILHLFHRSLHFHPIPALFSLLYSLTHVWIICCFCCLTVRIYRDANLGCYQFRSWGSLAAVQSSCFWMFCQVTSGVCLSVMCLKLVLTAQRPKATAVLDLYSSIHQWSVIYTEHSGCLLIFGVHCYLKQAIFISNKLMPIYIIPSVYKLQATGLMPGFQFYVQYSIK